MGQDYAIVPAEPGHAPELARMLAQTGWWPRLEADPDAAIAQVRSGLAICLEAPGHRLLVATDDKGKVLGYVSWHLIPQLFLPAPEAYISELFVRPAHRGRGIGNALLEAARHQALDQGCCRMMLVNGRQRDSYQRGFYKVRGWTERVGMANFVLALQKAGA